MVTFELKGKCFTVKPKDEKGEYTLDEAKELCNNLKDGWRIPTLDELRYIFDVLMNEEKDKLTKEWKFKTKNTNYLTTTMSPDNCPLSFDFNDGRSYLSDEQFKHKLRLIRD